MHYFVVYVRIKYLQSELLIIIFIMILNQITEIISQR